MRQSCRSHLPIVGDYPVNLKDSFFCLNICIPLAGMKKYMPIVVLLFICIQTHAHDDPGLPGDDPDVPLDGGTALLLFAGAVYGTRKIRELHQREKQ